MLKSTKSNRICVYFFIAMFHTKILTKSDEDWVITLTLKSVNKIFFLFDQ